MRDALAAWHMALDAHPAVLTIEHFEWGYDAPKSLRLRVSECELPVVVLSVGVAQSEFAVWYGPSHAMKRSSIVVWHLVGHPDCIPDMVVASVVVRAQWYARQLTEEGL